MPHVLVAGKIHDAGLALLRGTEGFTFDVVEEVSTASYAPLIAQADAVLIRTQPMPASVIADAPRLKIVSRHGVGYDAVDMNALNARHIPLAIVGDVNSRSVAEHTMMFLLAVAKNTLTYDTSTREAGWNYRNTLDAVELAEKNLLLLGFGRIARHVAKMAAAFGMNVMAYDPFVPPASLREAGVTPVSDLKQGLQQADAVSVHFPRSDNGPLLGAIELSWMKPTAIVVNTARGGIIDEQALYEALMSGQLRGAGLDVFSQEPPQADHPFLKCKRLVLSPHSAGLTAEAGARMSYSGVRNIVDFFTGRLDRSLVVNADKIAF